MSTEDGFRARVGGNALRGPPKLSRLWCHNCNEETLHRSFWCVHCNTSIRLAPLKEADRPSSKLRKRMDRSNYE